MLDEGLQNIGEERNFKMSSASIIIIYFIICIHFVSILIVLNYKSNFCCCCCCCFLSNIIRSFFDACVYRGIIVVVDMLSSYNIFSQILLQNSAQYLVWCTLCSYKIQFVELAW